MYLALAYLYIMQVIIPRDRRADFPVGWPLMRTRKFEPTGGGLGHASPGKLISLLKWLKMDLKMSIVKLIFNYHKTTSNKVALTFHQI